MAAVSHSEIAKAMWRRPEYRARHPRLLPPMRPDQRRLYKRLRDKGANRADALRVVMGEKPPGQVVAMPVLFVEGK